MRSIQRKYRALQLKLASWSPLRRWSAIVCLVWAAILALALAGELAVMVIGWAVALLGTAAGLLAIPAFLAAIVFACTFIPKRNKSAEVQIEAQA